MKKRFTLFLLAAVLAGAHAQQNGQWIPKGNDLLSNEYGTNDISVVDENIVWTVTCKTNPATYTYEDCRLLHSTDAGETWTDIDLSGLDLAFVVGVQAISEDTAWIGACTTTNHKKIYKTTDGGDSWIQQYDVDVSSNYLYPPSIKFVNGQKGFFIDVLGALAGKTEDGGNTWVTNDLLTYDPPIFIYWSELAPQNWWDVKGDTLWWGNSHYIARSVNGGADWEYYFTNLPEMNPIQTIVFTPDGLGLAISDQQTISGFMAIHETVVLRSEDFGATWTRLPNVPFPMSIIAHIPGTESGFVGVSGEWFTYGEQLGEYVSAFTLDGGNTWQIMDEGIARNAVRFASPSVGWAGRVDNFDYGDDNPVLFKWEGDLSTATTEILNNDYIRVHPNPFIGQTLLEFELSDNTQPVEIAIANVLGSVIQAFRLEKPNTGFNQLPLNIEAPAGLLLLTLRQGEASKTVKLVKE
jgi:photosystem II stability/assembly factor-like uncharacterized protein